MNVQTYEEKVPLNDAFNVLYDLILGVSLIAKEDEYGNRLIHNAVSLGIGILDMELYYSLRGNEYSEIDKSNIEILNKKVPIENVYFFIYDLLYLGMNLISHEFELDEEECQCESCMEDIELVEIPYDQKIENMNILFQELKSFLKL